MASATKSYRFGSFTLDLSSACLRREDTVVPLRPKSFDVLVYLVRNPGRLVTKDELIETVWPTVFVTENSLVQCIKDVRQALSDDDQTIIETVAKRGYLFTPIVVQFDAGPTSTDIADSSGAALDTLEPAQVPSGLLRTTLGHLRLLLGSVAIIAAATLVVAAVLWVAWRPQVLQHPASVAGQSENRLSVAVLPFGEADATTADDYFSKGISEDIAGALGRFPDLAVASPRLVAHFRSVGTSAQDLERQLKVRYLVEGSVRPSSERIRITVRLTDLQRGLLLWSHGYDEPADTILALNNDITSRIAGVLAVKLTNLEQMRAAHSSAGTMEAYDFVLRGRQLLTRLNRSSHSQARSMFERAIALDPRHTAAYVGLGRVDLSAVALGWTPDPAAALARAEGLARRALSLDEFSPAAHVLLGRTYSRMQEYDRAIDILNRAVALNPSEPDSFAGLGDALLWRGETGSAIKALETAISIDPRLSGEDLFSLGAAYFIADNLADATRVLERITTRNEGNSFIYAMLAAVHAESGRDAQSRSAAVEVRKLNPFFDVETFGSLFKTPEHRHKIAGALKKAGL